MHWYARHFRNSSEAACRCDCCQETLCYLVDNAWSLLKSTHSLSPRILEAMGRESNFMALDFVQELQQAHAYLDRLPPEQLSAVRGLLETMLDPLSRALANAPAEDEEISEEEERAVSGSREWLKHNKPIPHEEVLAEFGLTMEDFERMGRTPLPEEPNGADR